MKFCPYCGVELKSDADVCVKCGKLLKIEKADKNKDVSYGGFWKRFVAYLIDGIILAFIGGFIGFFIGLLFPSVVEIDIVDGEGITNLDIISSIVGVFVTWLYYAIMESSTKKATIGKMALGMEVVDEKGKRISFAKATGRHFGKMLSSMILCFGYFMAGWTKKKQALHDILANAYVINK